MELGQIRSAKEGVVAWQFVSRPDAVVPIAYRLIDRFSIVHRGLVVDRSDWYFIRWAQSVLTSIKASFPSFQMIPVLVFYHEDVLDLTFKLVALIKSSSNKSLLLRI